MPEKSHSHPQSLAPYARTGVRAVHTPCHRTPEQVCHESKCRGVLPGEVTSALRRSNLISDSGDWIAAYASSALAWRESTSPLSAMFVLKEMNKVN